MFLSLVCAWLGSKPTYSILHIPFVLQMCSLQLAIMFCDIHNFYLEVLKHFELYILCIYLYILVLGFCMYQLLVIFKNQFLSCVQMFSYVYIWSAYHVLANACRCLKRAYDPLEMELQTAVSLCVNIEAGIYESNQCSQSLRHFLHTHTHTHVLLTFDIAVTKHH